MSMFMTYKVIVAVDERCYSIERVNRKALLSWKCNSFVITLIGVNTVINIIHSVHNNEGMHSLV